MYDVIGKITDFNKKRLFYNMDSSGGQSGAGLWNVIRDENNDEIVISYGIHTRGFENKAEWNNGIRIDEEMFEFIAKNY